MPSAPTKQAGAETGLLASTGKPMSLGDATITASQAAPELTPGESVTVASKGGTTTQNAQALGHAKKQTATAHAAQQATQSSGGGFMGFLDTVGHDIGHGVETAVSDVGKALNAPLQLVQHEYRYLRDVEARHGAEAAILEGLGMAAGGVAGGLLAGPEGITLGAEAVGGLEGQLTYKTSWARTTTGAKYKTPTTGDVISIGRTIVRLLGITQHSRAYGTLSGVVDGISDLILTPLGNVGKVVGAARSAEGAGGALNKIWGGIGLQSPEDVERAYNQYRSVRTAFQWIADHDYGTILTRYGSKLAPIAKTLADATSAEEVKTIFKDVVSANELRTTNVLPTSTTLSKAAYALKSAAGNTTQLPRPLELLMMPVAKAAKNLQTVPGGWIDETGKIETKLDPLSGQGALTIYKMARYSQSDRTAKILAEAYAYADPADRIRIAKNAIMSTIEARAYREDRLPGDLLADLDYEEIATPTTRQHIKSVMDKLTGGANPATDGQYGKNAAGMEMGRLYTPKNDRELTQAILPSQTGTIKLPDFTQVKRMGTMLRGGKGYLGRIDTYLYAHVTEPFFKRWVLQTPAYALHMAAAEAVLNGQRLGYVNLLKASVYAAYSRLGYQMDEDAASGFAVWLDRVLGVAARTEDRVRYDAELYASLEGHATPEAVSAGHGNTSYMDSVQENASKYTRRMAQKGIAMKRGKEFASLIATDPGYVDAWQDASREMSRNEVGKVAAKAYVDARDAGTEHDEALLKSGQAATDWLRNTMSAEERALFPASRLYAPGDHPAGWDPLDTWGYRIAQSMHGLVGQDEDLTVARAIAEGRAPTTQELESIDPSLRPSVVKGRVDEPDPNSSAARLAAWGFRKVLNPMINKMSREPLFEQEYYQARKMLQPQVDAGILSDDEALLRAKTIAMNKAVKFVHNIHTRTQWSETVRNWFPFAFAQEQAYKRAGRLLLTDPGAFRRYQLMIQGVGKYVAQQTTPTGTKVFTLPGSGILGKGVPGILSHIGIPMTNATASLLGNFSSANVIFPLSTGFRPDLSPLAVISAKSLAAMFPETKGIMGKAVGTETFDEPLWKQAIPNSFAQRIISDVVATKTSSFANAMVHIIQQLDYEQNEAMAKWIKDGQKGPKPDYIPASNASPKTMQEFVNKVRNQTRVLYGIKALVGLVSPVSPEVNVNTFGLRKELTAEVKKQGSYAKGITVFLKKNPNATPYTVSESYVENALGTPTGVKLTESQQAQNWYDANQTIIATHQAGAAWLMPQPSTSQYSYQVYNEQLADHMRAKYAPETFLKQLYIAAGTSAWYKADAEFKAALTAAGNNKQLKDKLYSEWTTYQRSLAAASPIWSTYWNGNTRQQEADNTIGTLQTMLKHGLFPDNPQANAVKTLLQSYQVAESQYIAASGQFNYYKLQKEIKQSWYSYLTGLKKSEPRLEPIITSVFYDALGTVNVTTAKAA